MAKLTLGKSCLWVVVGFIFAKDGSIFISKRSDSVDQGGLWEFPGGKRELGETAFAALARELREEVGINVVKANQCLQFQHDYPAYSVFFDCWVVRNCDGSPRGCEGQATRWVKLDELRHYDFPQGNQQMLDRILALRSTV